MANNDNPNNLPVPVVVPLAAVEVQRLFVDARIEERRVTDMTPQAAEAAVQIEQAKSAGIQAQARAASDAANATIEVAKATHAIPSEQLTKRAIQQSYQHYASWAGALALATGAIVAASQGWLGTPLATVIVAIAGIFKVGEVVKDVLEKRQERQGDKQKS